MNDLSNIVRAEFVSSVAKRSTRCSVCGKRVKLTTSLLGGDLIEWHKPKRGSKSRDINAWGMCGLSGTVLPTKKNPRAL